MSALNKYKLTGEKVENVAIREDILGWSVNSQLLKDYIVAIRANARQWCANTKDKSEVNHSGAKPHPQKGTGKARQGSLASPQYKGGGVVFGPKPKFDQHVRINRKEKQAAIRCLLSEIIRSGNLHILQMESMNEPRTKTVKNFLKSLSIDNQKVLFLSESEGIYPKYENFALSMRNIPKVRFFNLKNISGYELMNNRHLVVMESALPELLALLGGE